MIKHPHYFSFSCGADSCRGLVQQTGPCSTCEAEVDVDNIKVEVEKVKQDLAVATSGDQQDGEEHYQEIRDIWIRWERVRVM